MKRLIPILLLTLLASLALAQQPARELLLSVDSVVVAPAKKGVSITVRGHASTAGWSDLALRLRSSANGHLIYDLTGRKPGGMVAQVLTPVSVKATWSGARGKVKKVTVVARTNQKVVPVRAGRGGDDRRTR